MAYLLYSLVFIVMVVGTTLYFTRSRWQQNILDISLPGRDYIYGRLPTFNGFGQGLSFSSSSFAEDAEAGLSSANFDLAGNIEGADGRAGLDDAAKAEILRIMKKRRLRFDEARRVYLEDRFRANGIAPDGRPRDPKFVSFS